MSTPVPSVAPVLDAKTARFLPWLVAVAFFMQMLDGTILNTALPAIAKDLGESPLRMQAVVISYMLTVALLIPASGWIADRFGSRRVFFLAIVVFTFGSLLCARSESLQMLVFSRVIQGIGGALMMPVGRLVILRAYPRSELVQKLAFVTIPGLIGPLVGPTLGGWLVDYASWHWIFLINLPVGVLGCVLTLRLMPTFYGPERVRFDWRGFLLFSASLIMISSAVEGLGELQMPKVQALILLTVGLACLCCYWLHAAWTPNTPLFSLALFKIRSFSAGIAGNLFARLGSGALPFMTPLFLQIGLGYTPTRAGMTMIPLALAGMAAKSLVKPLLERMGYRLFLMFNTLALGGMIAGFSLIPAQVSYPVLLAYLFVLGGINSMQFTAMNTVTLIDLRDSEAASGNGLLSVVMQLGMSLGIALASALLAAFPDYLGEGGGSMVPTFHATYLCIGLMSMVAAFIFLQLPHQVGKKNKTREEG